MSVKCAAQSRDAAEEEFQKTPRISAELLHSRGFILQLELRKEKKRKEKKRKEKSFLGKKTEAILGVVVNIHLSGDLSSDWSECFFLIFVLRTKWSSQSDVFPEFDSSQRVGSETFSWY